MFITAIRKVVGKFFCSVFKCVTVRANASESQCEALGVRHIGVFRMT